MTTNTAIVTNAIYGEALSRERKRYRLAMDLLSEEHRQRMARVNEFSRRMSEESRLSREAVNRFVEVPNLAMKRFSKQCERERRLMESAMNEYIQRTIDSLSKQKRCESCCKG